MNRLLVVSFVLFIGLVSCNKTAVTPPNSPYDGQWLWIHTSIGPFTIFPSPDSSVILSLDPGNLYKVTLAGRLSLQGTFSTDSDSYKSTIQFNNIDQPFGDTTTRTTGNMTEVYFNYAQVGRLVIFQNNSISISGDTLTMLRYPITPETPVSTFVRIGGGKR